MTDTVERAIGEAESWLISAKDKLSLAENDEVEATVCCSLAIHSIIRVNDSLTLNFMKVKATRHDDASALFAKMLQQGKISSGNKRFVRLIQTAMADKSGADYGNGTFSYEDAKRYVEEAEDFIAMAKGVLK